MHKICLTKCCLASLSKCFWPRLLSLVIQYFKITKGSNSWVVTSELHQLMVRKLTKKKKNLQVFSFWCWFKNPKWLQGIIMHSDWIIFFLKICFSETCTDWIVILQEWSLDGPVLILSFCCWFTTLGNVTFGKRKKTKFSQKLEILLRPKCTWKNYGHQCRTNLAFLILWRKIFSNYSDLIPLIEPFIENMAEMFLKCFSTKYLGFFCVDLNFNCRKSFSMGPNWALLLYCKLKFEQMKVLEFNVVEPWSSRFIIDVIHGDKFSESV